MFKARGSTNDGRVFVLLGLSAENVRRLKAGQPIRVDTQRATPEGLGRKDGPVIGVVFGETEENIAKEILPLMKELN